MVEYNNSQWCFAYLYTLVASAHIVNLDHVVCLNVSIAFPNTVICVIACVWLLRKIGFLIITSRKSHLFTGVQSLKSLWQNSLRAALGLDLDSLTPILGLKGHEGSCHLHTALG